MGWQSLWAAFACFTGQSVLRSAVGSLCELGNAILTAFSSIFQPQSLFAMSVLLAYGLETVPCSPLGDAPCLSVEMHCGSATPQPLPGTLFSAQGWEVAVVFRM